MDMMQQESQVQQSSKTSTFEPLTDSRPNVDRVVDKHHDEPILRENHNRFVL